MNPSIRSKGLWASLALIIACAACCALPLLSVLGIGAMTSAAFAIVGNSELKVLWVLGAFGLLVALIFLILRARSRRAACTTECSTDRSCCGPHGSESEDGT